MITFLQFKSVFPACKDPSTWVTALETAAEKFEINTKNRFAMWLAQCGHESAQYTAIRENLSYSARTLMAIWPRRFPTEQVANMFARQPQKLANYVYAGRMGNGGPETDDGWKYRGGGIIQLTGRANYKSAGAAIGMPLEEQPAKIEQPAVSALVGAWYWQSHGCNELADAGDFERITETINGPAKLGLKERSDYFAKLMQVMK